MTTTERFEETARRAVGRTLLFRKSKSGGTYNPDLDRLRAKRILPTLDEESLYELLMDVAREAAQAAKMEADHLKRLIVDEAKRVAVQSDSLSLWRYIEQNKEA